MVVCAAYKVLVHKKTGTSEHVVREGAEIVVGRDPDCNVSLVDGRVSRRHATVRLAAGRLEIVDLGSRNGTLVDGAPIEPQVPYEIRATSVVRIGEAVLVFEAARGTTPEQWCFDRPTFEQNATALLSSRTAQGHTGISEIRWTPNPATNATTTADPVGPSSSLQQAMTRIVGPRGLILAEQGRWLLLVPDTDPERLEVSASLLERLCDEQKAPVHIRAASSADARSVDALLARCTTPPGMPLVPPVIFKGGRHSVDALLSKLDGSDAPVLVVGETGVGKDVLARTLHARSRRANRPFVALNCAAFTEALFESELFGHERGAFTGATHAKTGLIESAAGGTVFLDEIGEMPLGLQAKLLRVVENREILRLGALVPKSVDVRFVFATNRDLAREVEQKNFRSDLYFRIASIALTIPPLRERPHEIVPLALHFIELASTRIGRPAPLLLPEAARLLEAHAWTGNVRELKNTIELAVLIHEGDVIRPSDIHIDRFVPVDAAPPSKTAPPSSVIPTPNAGPLSERDRILDALERTVWNQSEAAKLLGMPRRTLVKRLSQYDLPRPRKRSS